MFQKFNSINYMIEKLRYVLKKKKKLNVIHSWVWFNVLQKAIM